MSINKEEIFCFSRVFVCFFQLSYWVQSLKKVLTFKIIECMNYQLLTFPKAFKNHDAYKKTSGGGTNPIGGSPVCGSVPMGLLNKRI